MKKSKTSSGFPSETAVISVVEKRANELEANGEVVNGILAGVRAKLTLSQIIEAAVNGQRLPEDTDPVLCNVVSRLIQRCVAGERLSAEEVEEWREANHHELTIEERSNGGKHTHENGHGKSLAKKGVKARGDHLWKKKQQLNLAAIVQVSTRKEADGVPWKRVAEVLSAFHPTIEFTTAMCRSQYAKIVGTVVPDDEALARAKEKLREAQYEELRGKSLRQVQKLFREALEKAEALVAAKRFEPKHRELLTGLRDVLVEVEQRECGDEQESKLDALYERCNAIVNPKKATPWSQRKHSKVGQYVKVGENGSSFRSK